LGEFGGVRARGGRGKALDGGGIGAVEQIEELEVGVEPDSFSEIEAPGDARVEVDEWRRDEVIAALQKIYPVEMAVAIDVRRICRKPRAIVKAALRAENAAEVHFPRELHEAVQQEGVVQGQVG